MKIVVDKDIPFLADAVHQGWPNVDVLPMESSEIDACAVQDADVLVVRTRTRVDEALLSDSNVQMVCTATIGYDHIDTAWCERHGIRWMSCPGCNAQAVCDYIEEALAETQDSHRLPPNAHRTIGIVGVGHVGSLVAKMAERNGYAVLLNDPPKGIGVTLDEIAEKCDIITFHTPLTVNGEYPTYHLCNEAFLTKCRSHALIINAARGGIADEQALLHSGHPYILDTWENEPHINTDVLQQSFLASMHIAGYSVQGKRNATQMCLDAIAGHFGLPVLNISQYPYSSVHPSRKQNSSKHWLTAITAQLKASPTAFEALRRAYPLRGE